MKANHWIAVAAVFGALGIAIGAFGAHGLPQMLSDRGFSDGEIAKRSDIFETGARYHVYSALALLGIGLANRDRSSAAWTAAGWLLLSGGVVFSHLLYALAIVEGMRWLGAIVPLGGLLMILGWLAIAVAALRTRVTP